MRLQRTFVRFDWILLIAALALSAVGLVVMYGIGVSRPDTSLVVFEKQFVGFGIGLVLLTALCLIDYRQIRGLALPVYLAGAALLAGVLLFGESIRGTRGWYVLGGLSFQPVETAKICLIIFLAAHLVRNVHVRMTWRALMGSFAATVGYVVLVMLQPDFGSAMVMLAVWFLMTLTVGIPWDKLFILFGAGAIALLIGWQFFLAPYQKDRFIAFVNPAADLRGASYNVNQAGIAIGSGGLFGKGIGEGSQSRLRFLPEAATDFTFAVVGEELGFVGIVFVLGLFAILFHRLFRIAKASEDDFVILVASGVGALLIVHVTVSIGMNLGLMPVTGIPLPFLSAAPSFLLVVYLALGLMESMAVHRRANV